MKTHNFHKYLAPILGIALVFAAGIVLNDLFAATGIVWALALAAGGAIEGDPATHEAVRGVEDELDTDYISKKVVKMRPASTPLDTIMRQVPKQVKMNSFITSFYSADSREFQDAVASAYSKAGDGVTSVALEVDNVAMWSVDDTALFRGITGSQDSDDLVCLVIDKSATNNTITIQPLNGDTGAGTQAGNIVLPSIAEDTVIVRMGKAMNEQDAQAEPYAVVPTKENQYLQIFMAQVEEGAYQAMYKKEVEWGFNEYSEQNILDMKGGIEFSFLFGYQTRITQLTDSDERYLCGGITRDITETLEYGTGGNDRTINESDFIDWHKSIFTGNAGSEDRIFFMGDGLVSYISKIDTVSKQLEANKTEVLWGIKFRKIESNFGTLLCRHHPGLDLAEWGDKGIIIDPQFLERHTFQPMTIKKLDLKTAGIRNTDAEIMTECSAPVLKYPDVHKLVAPQS